jgi:hypothetical protein
MLLLAAVHESAPDAVDGSSTGTRVPWMWVLFRFVPILLQKSFCTRDQNFFWLYTRISCKDVGDLIA